jgi:AraC-like DNA-binding protein
MDSYEKAVSVLADLGTREMEPVIPYAEWDVRTAIHTPAEPYLEFYIVCEGRIRFRCSDQEHIAKAGEIVVMKAHRGNAGIPLTNHARHGCISVQYPDKRKAECPLPYLIAGPPLDLTQCEERLREIILSLQVSGERFFRVPTRAALLNLAILLMEAGGPKRPDLAREKSNLSSIALAALHSRAGDPRLSIGGLARELGVSADHLSRSIKAKTGFLPMAHLQRLRLKRACGLLRRTEAPIREIAQRVGYQDPLYFSRTFRKHFGCSPTAYRSAPR